jgi:hypothetical protein
MKKEKGSACAAEPFICPAAFIHWNEESPMSVSPAPATNCVLLFPNSLFPAPLYFGIKCMDDLHFVFKYMRGAARGAVATHHKTKWIHASIEK